MAETKKECKEKYLENMQSRTQIPRQPLSVLLEKRQRWRCNETLTKFL